jgi:hypothetical protein
MKRNMKKRLVALILAMVLLMAVPAMTSSAVFWPPVSDSVPLLHGSGSLGVGLNSASAHTNKVASIPFIINAQVLVWGGTNQPNHSVFDINTQPNSASASVTASYNFTWARSEHILHQSSLGIYDFGTISIP